MLDLQLRQVHRLTADERPLKLDADTGLLMQHDAGCTASRPMRGH